MIARDRKSKNSPRMKADKRGFGNKFKRHKRTWLTSAAKAEGFVGWERRAEALLHPVVNKVFKRCSDKVFQISRWRRVSSFTADERGGLSSTQAGKNSGFWHSLFEALFGRIVFLNKRSLRPTRALMRTRARLTAIGMTKLLEE